MPVPLCFIKDANLQQTNPSRQPPKSQTSRAEPRTAHLGSAAAGGSTRPLEDNYRAEGNRMGSTNLAHEVTVGASSLEELQGKAFGVHRLTRDLVWRLDLGGIGS